MGKRGGFQTSVSGILGKKEEQGSCGVFLFFFLVILRYSLTLSPLSTSCFVERTSSGSSSFFFYESPCSWMDGWMDGLWTDYGLAGILCIA